MEYENTCTRLKPTGFFRNHILWLKITKRLEQFRWMSRLSVKQYCQCRHGFFSISGMIYERHKSQEMRKMQKEQFNNKVLAVRNKKQAVPQDTTMGKKGKMEKNVNCFVNTVWLKRVFMLNGEWVECDCHILKCIKCFYKIEHTPTHAKLFQLKKKRVHFKFSNSWRQKNLV